MKEIVLTICIIGLRMCAFAQDVSVNELTYVLNLPIRNKISFFTEKGFSFSSESKYPDVILEKSYRNPPSFQEVRILNQESLMYISLSSKCYFDFLNDYKSADYDVRTEGNETIYYNKKTNTNVVLSLVKGVRDTYYIIAVGTPNN